MVLNGVDDEAERQLKSSFQQRAKSLRNEPEIFRCVLVTSLICEAVGFGVADEAKYFAAAYGDPAGYEYWQAHLADPMSIAAFAYLLSVHLHVKPEQLNSARVAIIVALRNAAAAGERLFIGDFAPLLAFKDTELDLGRLINVTVRPRAAVLWLQSNPKHEYFMPDSLRAFVEGKTLTRRRLVTSKNAQQFVTEYITSEKEAGRLPSQAGLMAAAKEADFHGGRELLRAAFRRSPGVTVKEGRPPKLAK